MEQNTLPKNWVETELKNIVSFIIGGDWGKDIDEYIEDSSIVLCIRGGELKNWKKTKGSTAVLRRIKNTSLEKRKIEKGDILLEISGGGPDQPVGRTVYIDEDVLSFKPEIPKVCTNFFRLVKLYSVLNSELINHYLQYFYLSENISQYQGGSNNLRNLKYKEYETIKIPLPPLAEQERIVKKLDALFDQLDGIREAMDRIPQLLKDFRQQVLTQAVTGKLTEEWRKGKDLEDWRQETLEKLVIKVGSGSTPRGGQESYSTEGIPLIRSMNVHFDGIHYDGLAYINEEQAYALRNVEVLTDDVLLNITGASIGRVCLAPKKLNGARVNQHVCIIRPNSNIIPYYLALHMSSPLIQSYIAAENYGVTRQALTKSQILNLNVLCPPFTEQEEIVRRVDSLFKQADEIEKQYKSLKEKIDTLPQAILHKAFKGELVEQLPSDGDARDLLRQIEELKKESKKK